MAQMNGKFYLKEKTKIRIGQGILCPIMFLIGLVMFLPFIYILTVSFTDAGVYQAGKVILWPEKWSLEAYKFILSGNGFISSLRSTLFITLVGTPLNVLFNAGVAYMLSKTSLPGRKILNKLIMLTMLFSPGMIPTYINMMNLGLLNSWWACILPASCGAWTIMVMKSFFQNIPKELEEAASIDGSSDLRTFATIILPLSKAMLATFTLFASVSYWNTYMSAVLYISKSTMQPLQVFLQQVVLSVNFTEYMDVSLEAATSLPQEIVKMACIIVAVLPIMCVYPFLQKHFAQGVMIGSVKG